jgi:threonine dehydrogenase-like Zn-dependent dehydrogenase
VLVVGCGGVGLNVVHGARLPGARPIVAVDLRDDELDYAKAFEAAINATPGCGRTVPRMTDGRGVERPFDAIGREKSALQVIDAVAPGGRAVLVGPARGGQGDDKPSDHAWRKGDQRHLLRLGAAEYRFSDARRSGSREKINRDDLNSRTYRFDG